MALHLKKRHLEVIYSALETRLECLREYQRGNNLAYLTLCSTNKLRGKAAILQSYIDETEMLRDFIEIEINSM